MNIAVLLVLVITPMLFSCAKNSAAVPLSTTSSDLSSSCPGVTTALTTAVSNKYSVTTSIFDWVDASTPTALCDESSATSYNSCIHGGLLKKVSLTGCTSCSNLSAADSLAAFDWSCDASSGTAIFSSTGFKSGKGIKDVVDAAAFKSMSLTVTDSSSAQTIHSSTATTWWSDTVAPLTSGATLSTANTIHTVANNLTSSMVIIASEKVAIVVADGAALTYNGTGSGDAGGYPIYFLIIAESRNYLWLEGAFSGTMGGVTTDEAIMFLSESKFATLRNVTIRNGDVGVLFAGMKYSKITGTFVSENGTSGDNIGGSRLNISTEEAAPSTNNLIDATISISNTAGDGARVDGTSANNLFSGNITVDTCNQDNQGRALILEGAGSGNQFSGDLNLANCLDGITIQDGTPRVVFSGDITLSNHSMYGIRLMDVDNQQFTGTITTSGSDIGIFLASTTGSGSNSNLFSGEIIASNNTTGGLILAPDSDSNIFSGDITSTGSTGTGGNAGIGIVLGSGCDSNSFSGAITVTDNANFGLYLVNSTLNTFTNIVTATGNTTGIDLNASDSNSFSGAITSSGNTSYGIMLADSDSNTFTSTVVASSNGNWGIDFSNGGGDGSDNNSFSNLTTLLNNGGGTSLDIGIMDSSENNTITISSPATKCSVGAGTNSITGGSTSQDPCS